jgi:hypothetical protein
MILHPQLRALRGDAAPQHRAQARMLHCKEAWLALPGVRAVREDIADFAAGHALAECASLAALFDDSDPAAQTFARSFTDSHARELLADPLGQVAVPSATDGTLSVLRLIQIGNVSLALVALDGEALAMRPEPDTVDFGANEVWEHVISGEAEAELIECRSHDDHQADLRRTSITLQPGKVICRDSERLALQVRRIEGCLVTLRLQRRRARAGITREYELAEGRLVHLAAGNPRDSRIEMMMALLGRMKRTDAAPELAAVARDTGNRALRWQALRECLALDTLTGFQTLCAIAADPADSLCGAATELRDQLIRRHPQLGEIEPCLA